MLILALRKGLLRIICLNLPTPLQATIIYQSLIKRFTGALAREHFREGVKVENRKTPSCYLIRNLTAKAYSPLFLGVSKEKKKRIIFVYFCLRRNTTTIATMAIMTATAARIRAVSVEGSANPEVVDGEVEVDDTPTCVSA